MLDIKETTQRIKLLTKRPTNHLKNQDKELYDAIYYHTKNYVGSFYTTKIRCDLILSDKHSGKHCPECHKIFYSMSKTCSYTCGNKMNSKNKEISEKRKKTNIERYGSDNPLRCIEVRKKYKKSLIEKYGVDNPQKNNDIKNRIKQTNIERYGVESTFSSGIVKEKIRQTNIERYGVQHHMKILGVKEKIRQTNIEKYGVDNPFKSDTVKEKIRQTNIKKYGVDNPQKRHLTKYFVYKEKVLEDIKSQKSLFTISNKYDIPFVTFRSLLRLWGIEYVINKRNSKYEISIENLLKNLNIQYEKNKRILDFDDKKRKKEIDFYIPDYNLGIELHGINFHHDLNIDSDYHLKKTIAAEKLGIKLLQFWGTNIDQKPKIVDSMIISKLGLSKRIYARKCKIKEVSYIDIVDFLNRNHLQGYVVSKYNLGLYYNNELVAVMTFGKSRFNKNYDWELLRYCSINYHNVIGGASKLLKEFKKQNKGSIISYSDRMISDGNLYKKLGFTFIHNSKPSYFYYHRDKNEMESRFKYQKHKLSRILEKYDNSKSESENMYQNDYLRLWDAGTSVWVLK